MGTNCDLERQTCMIIRLRNISDSSPGRLAWQRFRKDKVAFISVCFILLLTLVALLGYWITPDPTRDTDWQTLELATLPPGSRVSFFYHSKPGGAPANFWQTWLYGRPKQFTAIPIFDHKQSGDTLWLKKVLNYPYDKSQWLSLTGDERQGKFITRRFWLGTDRFGRDMLSRLIIGARVSLLVGAVAVIISLGVGIVLGALAGYFRGRMDGVISWLMNVVWSIPTLLLVITVTLMLGKGLAAVFIAVGLTMWVDVARVVRGQFLGLREREFVEAGKALGFTHGRIIFRHILPNVLGPLLVIAASNFASALLIESGLSFLGFGVQPPVPTWGNMIETNRNFLVTDKFHLAIIPGLAIMLLVLAFTLAGDGLRRALDERAAR